MPTIPNTVHSARGRLREVRGLALWVAASVALHVALLLLLPGMGLRDAGHVEILEVTLAKSEPPRVLEAPSPQTRKPLREDRNKRVAQEKPPREAVTAERATPPAQEPVPRPLLAMPRQTGDPETVLTLPAAPSAETLPRTDAAKAAVRPEPAKVAPSAADVQSQAEITPPNFNAGYLRNPPPRYPLTARRSGEQGTVTLKVLVTREGSAANISVQTSSGSASLDQAAMEAVKGWRFAPARQGTQPVEAWVLVPIVFKLEGVS